MDILDKNKKINEEEDRLRNQFSNIEASKKAVIDSVIQDAAFCAVEMEDLRQQILLKGVSVQYQNGNNQFGEKQSPESALYLKLSQRHAAAIKILLDCLQKSKGVPDDDGFDEFVNAGRPE